MDKVLFGVDDIHALRLQLAERRSKMSPDEARRDFTERVNRGRRAIEEIRAAKTTPMKNNPDHKNIGE